MAIPQLTTEQLQAARAAATEARRARAALKARVRTGDLTLAHALDEAAENEVLAHVKVIDLLKALPRVGDKRAALVMERYDIATDRATLAISASKQWAEGAITAILYL